MCTSMEKEADSVGKKKWFTCDQNKYKVIC